MVVLTLNLLCLIKLRKVKIEHLNLSNSINKQLLTIKQCCLYLNTNMVKGFHIRLAAKYGHLHCLKWFFKKLKYTVSSKLKNNILLQTIRYNHLECTFYLITVQLFVCPNQILDFIVINNFPRQFKFLLDLGYKNTLTSQTIDLVFDYNRTKFLSILDMYNVPINPWYEGVHNRIKMSHFKCFMYLMENGVYLYEECLIESIKYRIKSTKKAKYLVNLMLEYDCPFTSRTILEIVD